MGLVGGARFSRNKQAAATAAMRVDDVSPFPSGPERTLGGCECKSQCKTSLKTYHECDWCYVPSSCPGKRWAVTGYFDYCAYEPVSDYDAQTAEAKREALWERVVATKGYSGPALGNLETLQLIVGSSMRTSMDTHRDIIAPGRKKVIHSQGVVCKFDLQIDASSPYTGSLAPGSHPGLIRLGSATAAPMAPLPGLAVKFLRTNRKSDNFFALRITGDSGSARFFDDTFTNHVAPPAFLRALQKFQQASGCSSMVGLSDVCRYNESGAEAPSVNFPYEVFMDPHGDTAGYNGEDILADLARIPASTQLYTLRAKASPMAAPVSLGTLTTTSGCHTTTFGDDTLFFRHQRMEEDFALRPEWVPHVDHPGCKASTGPVSKLKCGN